MKLYSVLIICLMVLTNGGFSERASADTFQVTSEEQEMDPEAGRWDDNSEVWWDKYNPPNPGITVPTPPTTPTTPGTGEGQWIWGIWVPSQGGSTGDPNDPATGDDPPSTDPGTDEGQWVNFGGRMIWVPGQQSGSTDDPIVDDPEAERFDTDGDGFSPNEGDCDDADPSVYPGAAEICDGKDNNCNGQIDEGGVCQTCTDADGDGFFAEAGCGTEVDCNDNDASINPWTAEICDGKDNNCNGQTDEGGVCQTCTDADEDGFFAEAGCSTAVDCNDNDPNIYPGAPEICGDGINQDCVGEDEPCVHGNTPPEPPYATFPVGDTDLPLMPQLRLAKNIFFDADGDPHSKTRWFIATQPDDLSYTLVDEVTETQLLSWMVPSACILENNTQYYWAAAVFDGTDWSAPSNVCSFVTGFSGTEFDDNGIGVESVIQPDEEIKIGNEFIDEQGNLFISDTQKVFKSVTNPDIQIAMKVGQGCIIDKVCTRRPEEFVDGNSVAGIPEMPYGVVDFALTVPEKGESATVVFHFSEPLPEGFRWWKYDPKEGGFYDFMDKEFLYSGAGVLSVSSDRKKLILELTDGGSGDLIEEPDGKIYDSSGFGPAAATTVPKSSGGGGGSCFIRSLMF